RKIKAIKTARRSEPLNNPILCCYFCTVSETEYHNAVPADRDLVDNRQPQFFVKLCYGKRSALDVSDKTVEDFRLADPFFFLHFQFVNPLRGVAVTFKIAIVALVPLAWSTVVRAFSYRARYSNNPKAKTRPQRKR
ncbi:MAG: hypothetical protein FWG00_02880, partial [Coriobacteriia bacterium]|nr:hypothetical protein [Coriobacteriia bacterium]